jgi:hypothetical protein
MDPAGLEQEARYGVEPIREAAVGERAGGPTCNRRAVMQMKSRWFGVRDAGGREEEQEEVRG